MDKFIGKRLDGRYLIQNLIGSGGMANVYKAGDLKEQRIVAVKILREEFIGNEELMRRFKNESKAISVLNHPNIVKVYDVNVSEQLQYIVMEYIEGITLKDYMEYRKQPLTYKETLHFISQTLMALQHAHGKGIVHRDIKPQNIMMLPSGNIKVMDFGIARFSRSENQTMTDKAIGSVHYISPEQAKGDVTDSKADIYSAGVMMYEMLAGRLPFEGDSAVGVAIKQISDTAKPLRSINPAVPEALAAITERAMAKDPRARYQSAASMLTDIEAFKRNPGIKFNYQNVGDASPTRYIDKAVTKTTQKRTTASGARAPSHNGASARHQTKRSGFSLQKYLLPVLGGMAAAFGIASLIICLLLLKDRLAFKQTTDTSLPNFVNRTVDQIKKMPEYAKFIIEFKEEYNSDPDYPEGTAFAQTPRPPKNVKEGSKIVVRISLGMQKVPLPDVIGKEKNEAVTALRSAGFNVAVRNIVDETVPYGSVVKITGAEDKALRAGDVISAGTNINLYISRQKITSTAIVPQLVNMAKQDAVTLLESAYLSLGLITEVDSDLPAGTIMSQEIAPDTEVPYYTNINVQISRGHQHAYQDVEILLPATCMTVGKKRVACYCGDVQEIEIPIDPNAHKFEANSPTCKNGCGTANPSYTASSGGSSSSSSKP